MRMSFSIWAQAKVIALHRLIHPMKLFTTMKPTENNDYIHSPMNLTAFQFRILLHRYFSNFLFCFLFFWFGVF